MSQIHQVLRPAIIDLLKETILPQKGPNWKCLYPPILKQRKMPCQNDYFLYYLGFIEVFYHIIYGTISGCGW